MTGIGTVITTETETMIGTAGAVIGIMIVIMTDTGTMGITGSTVSIHPMVSTKPTRTVDIASTPMADIVSIRMAVTVNTHTVDIASTPTVATTSIRTATMGMAEDMGIAAC